MNQHVTTAFNWIIYLCISQHCGCYNQNSCSFTFLVHESSILLHRPSWKFHAYLRAKCSAMSYPKIVYWKKKKRPTLLRKHIPLQLYTRTQREEKHQSIKRLRFFWFFFFFVFKDKILDSVDTFLTHSVEYFVNVTPKLYLEYKLCPLLRRPDWSV